MSERVVRLTHKERRVLAELAKPAGQRDYSGVHGRTIHALERKGLYGFEGKRRQKRVTAAGLTELKIPDVFDDLFSAAPEKGTCFGAGPGPAERDPVTGNIEQGPHITRRHAISGDLAVLRVDRSPMNAKRWSLTLSCGHEVWISASKKPTRRTAKCPTCARE
jgi:hypothetical protein